MNPPSPVVLSALLTLCFALLSASRSAFAAEAPLDIPRADHPPRIDEYVGAPPPGAGAELKDFRQNRPGDGEPSILETRVYLSHDDENLYVVFVCKDDPNLLRARIARREDIFGDEGVQILIDTFHDKQRAYVFAANPYGVQLDSKLTEGLGYDYNFDTQWRTDGRIVDDGYIVTMEIPYKSLRFEQKPEQTWGIAVGRIIPRANEFSYWPYITERKEGFVPQFAPVRIDHEILPGRNIHLIPHVSYRHTRALKTDDDGSNPRLATESEFEAGLDSKFVIRDSIAVDLTVNPDFSEVESDEPQIIVNQRFEVLFPEKRPFFLENSAFFGTPVNLFFSRRIVEPQYGARVTGRVDRWAIGGLIIDDEQAGNLFGFDDPDFDDTGRIAVARVQRDIGTQSNVGVIATDRRVGDRSNQVAGFDARLKVGQNWALTGQAVRSESDEAAFGERDGHLWFVQAQRGGRSFIYDGQYIDISRDFETELGFVPRTDIKQFYQVATWLKHFPEAPWLVNMGPTVNTIHTWDQEEDLQDRTIDASFKITGLNLTEFNAHWIESYEQFAGEDFDKRSFSLGASSELTKWFSFGANVTVGDATNYFPAAGLVPFLGDARQARVNFTIKPIPQFRIDQIFIWSDLRTDGEVAGRDDDSLIFRDVLSRTKFTYQFNRFWNAHLIADYGATTPDSDLVGLTRSRRLTGDVLVSYVLNPGTTFYFGYTDQQQNLRLFRDPRELQLTDDLDLHTGRQVFMKLSYLFDF